MSYRKPLDVLPEKCILHAGSLSQMPRVGPRDSKSHIPKEKQADTIGY